MLGWDYLYTLPNYIVSFFKMDPWNHISFFCFVTPSTGQVNSQQQAVKSESNTAQLKFQKLISTHWFLFSLFCTRNYWQL